MAHSLVSPEVVDTLFARLNDALPVFVSAMPSIRLGMMITFSIIFVCSVLAYFDKKNTKTANDPITKTRWILFVIAGVVIGGYVGDYMKDRDYTIRCITLNKQHYANVHWLKLYRQAYKV